MPAIQRIDLIEPRSLFQSGVAIPQFQGATPAPGLTRAVRLATRLEGFRWPPKISEALP